jgi:hypothetical protein
LLSGDQAWKKERTGHKHDDHSRSLCTHRRLASLFFLFSSHVVTSRARIPLLFHGDRLNKERQE